MAAGCLYALDQHVERLREDHIHAQQLARGLGALPGIRVRTPHPETNMVFFDVDTPGWTTASLLTRLEEHGIKMSSVAGALRAVTHLDVTQGDITYTLEAMSKLLAEGS